MKNADTVHCNRCLYWEQYNKVAECTNCRANINNINPNPNSTALPLSFIPRNIPDQTAKADSGKPQLRLVPTEIINCIARVREYGNNKYHDPDNWKTVEKERYIDAMFRHMLAYVNDNNGVDEESGLPHLWHLACNVAFLCDYQKKEMDKNETK